MVGNRSAHNAGRFAGGRPAVARRVHIGESMRTQRFLAALAAISLALAACASVDVHTMTSPDAHLGALHTFSVMSIIDVLDPRTKELLWRGQGVARVSDDEPQCEQDLWKTVTAILEKFPPAGKGS
jgi:hypothetical protein